VRARVPAKVFPGRDRPPPDATVDTDQSGTPTPWCSPGTDAVICGDIACNQGTSR
jgi:hypothetical protein